MRNLFAACLLALAAVMVPVTVMAVTAPDLYGADKIIPGRNAYIEDKVAAFNAKKVSDPEATLMIVTALNPDNPSYVTALSAYAGPASDYSFLVGILSIDPKNGMAAWAMAEKLTNAGFHTLALPYHRIASDAYPTAYSTQNKAGLNAYFAGDWAACIFYFDRSRRIDHPYAFGADEYAKLGECNAFAGNNEQAISNFKAAISRDASIAGTFGARMVEDKVFGGCKGSAATKTASATKFFAGGKAYEAYRDVHAALVCDPGYIPALDLRLKIEEADPNLSAHAHAHRKLLDNIRDGGQTNARDTADLKPRTATQLITEASKLDMTVSNRNVAWVAYLASQALRLEPDNWEANLYMARALVNLGDDRLNAMAWAALTKADVTSGPLSIDRATIHNARGVLYHRAGLNVEALAELNAAIAISPADMRFYLMRGIVLVALGAPDKAIADFDFVVRFQPKNTAALTMRAKLYYQQKNWAAARGELENIYALAPDNDGVRADIIRMLDLEGNTSEANARHRDFLVDDEPGAQGNAYLAKRATPVMLAEAATLRGKNAAEAGRKAAIVKLQAIQESYTGADWAKNDHVRYVEQQLERGTSNPDSERKEVVRLIDAAVSNYRDTMTLILDLKGSDLASYVRPDEIAELDRLYEESSQWVDHMLESRKRYRWE